MPFSLEQTQSVQSAEDEDEIVEMIEMVEVEEYEQAEIQGDFLEFNNFKRVWNAESSNKQLDESLFKEALKDI